MSPKRRNKVNDNIKLYMYISLGVFLILVAALFKVQIIDSNVYATKATDNRMRLITKPGPRGDIITSDNVTLVRDYPSFQVSIMYLGLNQREEVINKLVEVLNDPSITEEYINSKIDESSARLYQPIVIKRGLTIEEVSKIEARKNELQGVTVTEAPDRNYIYPSIARHVIGYLSEISDELGKEGYEEYRLGDLIGRIGIEKEYDKILRGHNGYQQVEVNAKNRPIRVVSETPAIPGKNVILTLDFKLQKKMDDYFDELLVELQKKKKTAQASKGAAVLIEVKTGRILAMTSRPNDPIQYQNKAIQGRFIPGSTFKMITGMAALEYAGISPNETVTCTGAYWKKPYIKCHGVHGKVNYYSAIAKSCNVYFQEMGRRVTVANIAKVGEQFGLDEATGIDLPYESSGEYALHGLPTEEKRAQYFEWAGGATNKRYENKMKSVEKDFDERIASAAGDDEKKELEREKKRALNRTEAQWKIDLKWNTEWHEADTYNISIGQGRQNYTPLQLATYTAQIANKGVRMKPYIVDKIIDENGEVVKEFNPVVAERAEISERTLRETVKAMVQTSKPGGTTHFLFYKFPKEIEVASKTGTAQREVYVEEKDINGNPLTDSQGNVIKYKTMVNNGLFVAFAPADDPQIAFAGIVEAGNSGSGSAGRIAKELFEEYFGINETKE